jgi:peptidoglycan/LPS O-acetylase OafA/YrhL
LEGKLASLPGKIEMNGQYFKGIDSMRFFAFLLVFFYHVPLDVGGLAPVWVYLGRSFPVVMDLFFLISSYLIVHLAYSEYRSLERFAPGLFLIRRGLRIYPLYFLVVFGVFAAAGVVHFFVPALWPYLVFVANYFLRDPNIFALAILWSVCVEEQFYFVLAFLMKYYFPRLPWICLFACVMFIGFKWGVAHYGWQDYGNTLNYVPDFAAGAILAVSRDRWRGFVSGLSCLSVFLGYLFILIILLNTPILEAIPGFGYVDTIIYAALWCFPVAHQSASNRYFQWSRLGWISYMGKRTYGLYVYHPLVILLFLKVLHLSGNILVLPMLATTLLVADLSYRFFEKPILSLRTRFTPSSSSLPG